VFAISAGATGYISARLIVLLAADLAKSSHVQPATGEAPGQPT
jgi:hypothetical protein